MRRRRTPRSPERAEWGAASRDSAGRSDITSLPVELHPAWGYWNTPLRDSPVHPSNLRCSVMVMESIAVNKDARRRYHILDTLEAGIVLSGHEVKSARRGTVSLKGAFVVMKGSEPTLLNAHIGSFQPRNAPAGYDPVRPRKLLLHAAEIKRLLGKRAGEGLTLVPLRLYTSRARVKVQIGIARSKSKADQREAIKARQAQREIRRALRPKAQRISSGRGTPG